MTCARRPEPVFFGLPTLYTALSKAPEARTADLSSLRICVSAAEILAAEVFKAWKQISRLEIMEGLGSSEVLHIAPCYWNRPDKTEEIMREGGWIYTGDRFVRDAEGFHYVQGRADDLVKISGQWVYPLEVELCLANHPMVRECAVLATEGADKLTTLKAFVVLADGSRESDQTTRALQEYVKGQLLPYKYPRLVSYVDELPKTGSGKIDRQSLLKPASGEGS
jgi:acetyl-CoA synthetase